MAMKCNKCGGIIPDVMFNGASRCDCGNHTQPEINIDMDAWHGKKQLKCDAILGAAE